MEYKLKPELVFQNLIRCFILSLFVTLVLIFIMPLSLNSLIVNNHTNLIKFLTEQSTLIIRKYKYIFIFISVFSPVMITTIIFRSMYLKTDQSSMFQKVSRESLFFSNVFAALILILLPFLITMAVCLFMPLSPAFSVGFILHFFLLSMLYQLFVFSVSVLIIVTVRSILIQTIYILTILMLPMLLEYVISISFEQLLYGCVIDLGKFGTALRISPIYKITLNHFSTGFFEWIVVLLFTVLIFKFSMDIFIKNIPDKNMGYIRFDKAKGIYRFLFFVFFGLISIIVSKNSILILIIYSLSNLLICELILNGRLVINKGQKWYILFIASLIIIYSIFRFDLYHISDRKIYINEVERIYIGTNYYNIDPMLKDSEESELIYDFERINLIKKIDLTADKINKVINFHEGLVAKKPDRKSDLVYIAYLLKNNKKIIRRYQFDYRELLNE